MTITYHAFMTCPWITRNALIKGVAMAKNILETCNNGVKKCFINGTRKHVHPSSNMESIS